MPSFSRLFSRQSRRTDRKHRRRSIVGRTLHSEHLEQRQLLAAIHVATDGDDGAGDGSLNAPFQTLQHAVNEADPGDVINLRQGTYLGGVTIHDPDITVQSFPGEWASITAPIDDTDYPQVLRFHYTADGGTLSNVELVGGFYYALKLETNWDWGVPDADRNGASNITIQNSILHDSGRDAIKITPGCDDVHILNNEIYNTGMRYSGNAEGIDNVNGDRMIVRGNYIHDIATNGIYPKGGSIGSIIENNLIANTGNGGVQIGYYTDYEWFDEYQNPDLYESIDTVVRNNVIMNTFGAGIGFWASLNAEVYNNTLVNVGEGQNAGVFFSFIDHWVSSTEYITQTNVNPMFVNNIITQSPTAAAQIIYMRNGGLNGGAQFSNNIWYDADGTAEFGNRLVNPANSPLPFSQWQAELGDTNSQEINPGLDATLHLQAGSPAIDAAALLANLTHDYDGQIRTGLPDIGADELVAGTPLSIPPAPGTVGTGGGNSIVLPSVHLESNQFTVNESDGTVEFTVQRSAGVTTTTTVNYAWSDVSTTAGVDYFQQQGTGTLQFAPGETTKTVALQLVDDNLDEGQETLHLVLSNPTGGVVLGAPSLAQVDILDDDHVAVPGTVSLSATEYNVDENAGVATVTVTRTVGIDGAISVDYATSDGSAVAGADYSTSQGSVEFIHGQTEATINIPLTNDSTYELSESFSISLTGAGGGASLGSTTQATVLVEDDDPAPPAEFHMEYAQLLVTEDAGTVAVQVMRSGNVTSAATVDLIGRAGSATDPSANMAYRGSDHNWTDTTLNFAPGQSVVTVNVPILNDDYAEYDEHFWLGVSTPSGNNTIGSIPQMTVTIRDDESQVRVASWQFIGDESNGNVAIEVERVGDVSTSASVDYATVPMSASAGNDFVMQNGTIQFLPQETSHQIVVQLVNDELQEAPEQFGLALSNITGGSTLGRDWAYVVVQDDDTIPAPGVIGFAAATAAVDENAGQLTLTVNRENGTTGEVSVQYQTLLTTASENDVTLVSGTLTFADGQMSQTINVPLHDDDVAEGAESFIVELHSPTNGSSLGQDSLQVTLVDDEAVAPVYELSLQAVSIMPSTQWADTAEATITEGAENSIIAVVSRSGDIGLPSDVTLLFRGGRPGNSSQSAYGNHDFIASDTTLQFGAGEATKTVVIPIADDTYAEPVEYFRMFLVQPTNGSEMGETSQIVVGIEDNESEIAVSTWQSIHNEGDGTAQIVIRRNGNTDGQASVQYSTIQSSATSDIDYAANTGTLHFAPGEYEKVVDIVLTDDADEETDEVFGFLLHDLTGDSTMGRAWQYVVIEDND